MAEHPIQGLMGVTIEKIRDMVNAETDSTDGIMKKGWVQLDISNEDPEEETAWFYFDPSPPRLHRNGR